uniref:Transcription factor domain-containing protein n=1 Tax=Bionectria ochroleuca TaxID=29856 RepID=A0A8H7N8N4_BIOOC
MAPAPIEIVFSLAQGTKIPPLAKHIRSAIRMVPSRFPGRGNEDAQGLKVAEPSFQFIETSTEKRQIDAASRSKIRSHARKRRADPDTFRLPPKGLFQGNLQQISGVDPFGTACIPLDSYMLDLLSLLSTKLWTYMYSLEEVGGWNPIQNYWLPIAFYDAALMHSFLACTDSYVKGYAAGEVGAFGLHHLQQVICIVNKRLAKGETPISRGTIAVISGISLLEGPGRHRHWRTHMKGLKALVELSGGLDSFASEPLVMQKIYRADLYGSMDAGELPFFSGPVGAIDNIYGMENCHDRDDTRALHPLPSTGGDCPLATPQRGLQSEKLALICDTFDPDLSLTTCIRGLEGISHYWIMKKSTSPHTDSGSASAGRDDPSLHEIARMRRLLTGIQYKLVLAAESQHEMDWCPFQKAIYELLRVTLIIYALSILKERPQTTSIGKTVSSSFLRAFITAVEMAKHVKVSQSDQSEADETRKRIDTCPFSPLQALVPIDFFLWSIFLAVALLPTGSEFREGKEVKTALLNVFSSLVGIQTQQRDEIKSQISQYLWISYVHNDMFDSFWSDLGDWNRVQSNPL